MLNVSRSVLVVAHPDDEVIFFSSIMAECKRVIICFGPCENASVSAGRQRIEELYPLKNVSFLNIQESNVYDLADWVSPKLRRFGIEVTRNATGYERSFQQITRALKQELQNEESVVTHNPWGEYGHEEHVQVFSSLKSLVSEMGYEIYVGNYVSNRSWTLMQKTSQQLMDDAVILATNSSLTLEISSLYINNNCWTWLHDYRWPDKEVFYPICAGNEEVDTASAPTKSVLSLNLLRNNF